MLIEIREFSWNKTCIEKCRVGNVLTVSSNNPTEPLRNNDMVLT